MIRRTRLPIAVALLVAASGALTACSSEPSLTFDGLRVQDAAADLDDIEESWREERTRVETPSRVAEDAQCYFQVSEGEDSRAIASEALCGPVRYVGSDLPTWDAMRLTGDPDGDRTSLSGTFERNDAMDPRPSLALVRADGEEAPTDVSLDEPDPAIATPGALLEVDEADASGGSAIEVALPGGTLTLDGLTILDQVGPVTGRYVAPADHAILVLSSGWAGATASMKPTVSVVTGETSTDAPVGEAHGVVVPGDGSQSIVRISSGGRDIDVDPATGDIVAGTPVETDEFEATVQPADAQPATGWSYRDASVSISGVQTTWTEDGGWAPEGQSHLILSIEADPGINGYQTDSMLETYFGDASTIVDVTLTINGTAAPVDFAGASRTEDDAAGRAITMTTSTLVPAGAITKIDGAYLFAGKHSADGARGAPERLEERIPFSASL